MREYEAPLRRRESGDGFKNRASHLTGKRPDALRQRRDAILFDQRENDIEPIMIVDELATELLGKETAHCVLSNARWSDNVDDRSSQHTSVYKRYRRAQRC